MCHLKLLEILFEEVFSCTNLLGIVGLNIPTSRRKYFLAFSAGVADLSAVLPSSEE